MKSWSADNDKRLLDAVKKGVGFSQIAAGLGKSRAACIRRVSELEAAAPKPEGNVMKQKMLALAAEQEAEEMAKADIEEGKTEFELIGLPMPGEAPQFLKRVFSRSGKLLREEVVSDPELNAAE